MFATLKYHALNLKYHILMEYHFMVMFFKIQYIKIILHFRGVIPYSKHSWRQIMCGLIHAEVKKRRDKGEEHYSHIDFLRKFEKRLKIERQPI